MPYDTMTYGGTLVSTGAIPAAGPVTSTGGAGTLFMKLRSDTYGSVTLDNGGLDGRVTPTVEDGQMQMLTVSNGAIFEVGATTSVTVHAAALAGLTLINNGTLNLPAITTLTASAISNHGIYNHSGPTLRIEADTTWIENGVLPTVGDIQAITDLVIAGTLEFHNQLPAVAQWWLLRVALAPYSRRTESNRTVTFCSTTVDCRDVIPCPLPITPSQV